MQIIDKNEQKGQELAKAAVFDQNRLKTKKVLKNTENTSKEGVYFSIKH